MIIVLTIFLNILNVGHAATIQEIYSKDINVALTSIGNISKLDFSLNGDYSIVNQ